MRYRPFGPLGKISALTLGGGGTGQVWGATTRNESVATVRAAVDAGITFLDVAPSYGNGESENVIGEAFNGKLPEGVRILTKYGVLDPPIENVQRNIETSLNESLARLKLDHVDLFVLHNQIIPANAADRYRGTTRTLFVEAVRPVFERLVASGKIGAWGITAIGMPDQLIETIQDDPKPAVVQAIANLLDSPGSLKRYDGDARPRDIIAAAKKRRIAVMGIRAVQAGALTSAFDRPLPDDHPDRADFERAAPFRTLAEELGESPASLAHRYALSIDGVSTIVLGVKNRTELQECLDAEERGPLAKRIVSRIDAAVAPR